MVLVSAADGQAAVKRVLQSVTELAHVRIGSMSSKAYRGIADGDSVSLVTELAVSSNIEEGSLVSASRYRVAAIVDTNPDDQSDIEVTDENAVWRIEVEVISLWSLEQDAEISELDGRCFALGQGAMTCHPYAREFIQSLSTRMNYPPATLDIIINPWFAVDELEVNLNDD